MTAHYEIAWIAGGPALLVPVVEGNRLPAQHFYDLFAAQEYARESYRSRGLVAEFTRVEPAGFNTQPMAID